MTLLRMPTTQRGYLVGAAAGIVTTLGVTAAGRLLVRLGLHADLTYLDDILLGILVALLVLALRGNHDRQRSNEQLKLAALIATHRSVAAEFRNIATLVDVPALAEIANQTAERIDAIITDVMAAHQVEAQAESVRVAKRRQTLTLRQVG
jgi:hypothetical protein